MMLSPEVMSAAKRLLSQSLGEEVQVDWGSSVPGYPHVHRGKVDWSSQSESLLVILKFPQKADRWPRLCNDWAGCQFLASIPEAQHLCPKHFGANSEFRFTLSQEIEGQTFTQMLMAPEEDIDRNQAMQTAWSGFGEFGGALGRLHSSAYGLHLDYDRVRKSIGPVEEHVNFDLPGRVRATQNAILKLLDVWQVNVSEHLIDEINDVIRVIADAQPYLTYTHIDLNPNNLLITPEGNVRIIDFDSGAYRHAFLDGVWPRMGFPGHWPALAFPRELLARFEDAYRLELSQVFGEAVDDDHRFYTAITDACAFWTLFYLGWAAEAILEDRPNADRIVHLRHRLIVTLTYLLSTIHETGLRPELGRMAESMLAFARSQWGEDASDLIRVYPIFVSSE